jgi:hypothetical protein
VSRGDPAALRASLDARLISLGESRNVDPNRLRRHLTFQRLLRRLADGGGWVLKGGYLLEARLGAAARATRDLDLARAESIEAVDLRSLFERDCARDVDGDGFVFTVTATHAHLRTADDGPGLHLSVTADLAGRPFATIRVHAVARPDELAGGTELVTLPPVLAATAFEDVSVPAVDLAQHAAEKLHALAHTDAHPRPSTRVKDLVDLVLLLDAGVLDDARLRARLEVVFRARDGGGPPTSLPAPPEAWRPGYAEFASRLSLPIRDLDLAMAEVSALYARSIQNAQNPQEPNQ